MDAAKLGRREFLTGIAAGALLVGITVNTQEAAALVTTPQQGADGTVLASSARSIIGVL